MSRTHWKALIHPAMIFIPLGLGAFSPWAGQASFLIRWLLLGMIYCVFLRLEIRALAPRREHWRLLLANLAIGVIPALLLQTAGMPQLAQAAFFVGITPTATAASVIMGFLRGRVEFVISAFMVTNIGIALALPWLLPWICGNYSWDFAGQVAQSLLFVLVLPGVLAGLTRLVHPQAAAWPQKKSVKEFCFALWSAALFLIAANAAAFFAAHPEEAGAQVAAIAAVSAGLCALNFALGHRLGGNMFAREASQSLGQKNTTLTIYLALTHASPLAALGPVFYVLWHNTYNAWQIFQLERKDGMR